MGVVRFFGKIRVHRISMTYRPMEIDHAHVSGRVRLTRATVRCWRAERGYERCRQRTVLRGRIMLMLGEGLAAREVARRLGVSRHSVDLSRRRDGAVRRLLDVVTVLDSFVGAPKVLSARASQVAKLLLRE